MFSSLILNIPSSKDHIYSVIIFTKPALCQYICYDVLQPLINRYTCQIFDKDKKYISQIDITYILRTPFKHRSNICYIAQGRGNTFERYRDWKLAIVQRQHQFLLGLIWFLLMKRYNEEFLLIGSVHRANYCFSIFTNLFSNTRVAHTQLNHIVTNS